MKQAFAFLAILLPACYPTGLQAAQLHGLFTDNMVLQRDRPVAVYGTGEVGETVTVEIGGLQASGTVVDGRWKVVLPPLAAGGPHTLKVTGNNAIALKNVMCGDVWLCTGQSNMAGLLKAYKRGDTESRRLYDGIPAANPLIRLFKLKQDGADTPQREVVTDSTFGPTWRECDEESALEFSATGYLFGSKLQPEIGVPVGLIYATLGGTSAECWVSAETLRSRPEFKDILDGYEASKAAYPKANEQYLAMLSAWQAMKPTERNEQKPPQPPMGPQHPKRPSGLFNFMIAPLQEFTVKGAIWYQGEGNASRAIQYRQLFPALISSWRQQWGLGDFPFLFVQLAAYRKANPEPEDTDWAWLREAQAMTLTLPNTGMAVAIDAGHQTNIHPPDKPTVGTRLAAAALKVAYGRDLVASGPTFQRLTISGSQAVLDFDNLGGGLVTKAVEADGHFVSPDSLRGFAVCGPDQRFYWADAVIRGRQVVVSSSQVSSPVAVRYAWANFPLCNLYNREGFPAVPFRTDQFEPASSAKVGGIGVGKPFVCNHPITNGLYGGLTDGSLSDSNKTAWASSGAMKFPKHVTVDLQGKYDLSEIRVYNSALGGTKTVEVQASADGTTFTALGKTEFKNYSGEIFELNGLNAHKMTHVRLFFPDVHEISFQRKANGFVFLRELEIQGVPAR
jgi:sialate O-acetylesterase